MKIVYISIACSKDYYAQLFKDMKIKPGQQVQKYHKLILEGISATATELRTISIPPVTRSTSKKHFIKKYRDIENNVIYNYSFIINLPIIKNIANFSSAFWETIRQIKADKESAVICDVLNVSISAAALLASKILRRNSVGIVTDIPAFVATGSLPFFVKLNNFILSKFDSYVFLTENMNELINKKNVPYEVIEGQVDIRMKNIENKLESKFDKKICIYAGGLQRIYGIDYLVKGFLKANVHDSELHIYGNGDYENELIEICKHSENVKYFGVIPNDIVVQNEIMATLLVNPRPSSEEYTKYSFPSKNMEYMVSGTPILTTNLPGMPSEYLEHVYLIDDESIDGLSDIFKDLLNRPRAELHEKGLSAKKFVLQEKNNIIQSKKIIDLIQKLI